LITIHKRLISTFVVYCFAFSMLSMTNPVNAAAFDLSIIGAASSSSYRITPAPDVLAGGTGFGLGVLMGFDLFPFFALETGVLYLGHNLAATAGGVTANISYNHIQFPALLRFAPITFFELELGGYYAIPASASSTGDILSELVSSASSSYTSSNDFGLLLGAGLRMPLLPLMSLRVDALYEYGLKNLSTGTSTQYSRSLDIWAGVMISLI
jgi:hypothetical protein